MRRVNDVTVKRVFNAPGCKLSRDKNLNHKIDRDDTCIKFHNPPIKYWSNTKRKFDFVRFGEGLTKKIYESLVKKMMHENLQRRG